MHTNRVGPKYAGKQSTLRPHSFPLQARPLHFESNMPCSPSALLCVPMANPSLALKPGLAVDYGGVSLPAKEWGSNPPNRRSSAAAMNGGLADSWQPVRSPTHRRLPQLLPNTSPNTSATPFNEQT